MLYVHFGELTDCVLRNTWELVVAVSNDGWSSFCSLLSLWFPCPVWEGERGIEEENYSCFIFAFHVSVRFMGGRGDGTESTNHSVSGMCSNPLVASSSTPGFPSVKKRLELVCSQVKKTCGLYLLFPPHFPLSSGRDRVKGSHVYVSSHLNTSPPD